MTSTQGEIPGRGRSGIAAGGSKHSTESIFSVLGVVEFLIEINAPFFGGSRYVKFWEFSSCFF